MRLQMVIAVLLIALTQALAADAELPASNGYCVSFVDADGQILGRIDLKADNAAKQGHAVTRQKVKLAIRGLTLSALVNRPDLAALAENIVLPGDDALAEGESGIVCKCAKLECSDPTVCGISCKGPCEDCFVCRTVNGPGAPVKGRPRK